jgi:hypothetical protein
VGRLQAARTVDVGCRLKQVPLVARNPISQFTVKKSILKMQFLFLRAALLFTVSIEYFLFSVSIFVH